MNIKIQAKNYTLSKNETDALTKKIEHGLNRFVDKNEDVNVKVIGIKNQIRAEVAVVYMGYKIHSEYVTNDSILTAIDKCVDILDKQIARYKTKIHKSVHKSQSLRNADAGDEFVAGDVGNDNDNDNAEIVKVENYQMKLMSVDEAILQMRLMDFKFFIFRNQKNGEACVVYLRDDGNIGLIEPEIE